MHKSGYMPRLIDSELELRLRAFGAVLLEGPKFCGKTTSAEHIAASTLYMQDEDRSADYLKLADIRPSNLLVGDNPRLIDEWQMAPKLWGAVRFDIDRRGEKGLYILTGSVSVDEDSLSHSGAGRISRLKMRTMTLQESGDSSCEVSLGDMLGGRTDVDGTSPLDYGGMARALCRGGWPESVGTDEDVASAVVDGYCDALLRTDINLPEGRRRSPRRTEAILRSLSRNTATSASARTIISDMTAYDGTTMSPNTLADYREALRMVHVIDDLPAWTPKLRSKAAIRTSDTIHLTDPAIAAHFLGAGPRDLEMDPNTYGLLFESLAVRDIRTYAQHLGGQTYHYRDEDGLEADIVVHLRDGRWGAMEVKLGGSGIDDGARNLLRLAAKVDRDSMSPPSFLAVVTGTEFAYTREDGVHVIPLGCLKA